MRAEEPPSLWNFGEIEPWRRGRNAIILIAALIALGQILNAAVLILLDDLGTLVRLAIFWLIFWFQFYLIWIGWNWVRWLNALFLTASGLFELIWGMRGYSGFHMTLGAYLIGVGTYLGMAPSVYAFARHQRENVGLGQALFTGAAFVALICGLGATFFGLQQLKLSLEKDAFEFARVAFNRVFQDHDVAFLATNASAIRKNSSPAAFMEQMQNQLGNLQGVDRPIGQFAWKIDHSGVRLIGEVRWEAQFSKRGPAMIDLNLTGNIRGWEIDHLGYY